MSTVTQVARQARLALWGGYFLLTDLCGHQVCGHRWRGHYLLNTPLFPERIMINYDYDQLNPRVMTQLSHKRWTLIALHFNPAQLGRPSHLTLTPGILYVKSKVLVGQTSFLLYQISHVLEKMLFFSSDPCDIEIIFRGLDFLIPSWRRLQHCKLQVLLSLIPRLEK